jgi:hypothetical protein
MDGSTGEWGEAIEVRIAAFGLDKDDRTPPQAA